LLLLCTSAGRQFETPQQQIENLEARKAKSKAQEQQVKQDEKKPSYFG